MRIETDLKRVEALAAKNEDVNWEFRCFLKGSDYSAEEIDAVVHRLFKEVSAKIDCTDCANCCKQISPLLQSKDIGRFIIHLKTSQDAFVDRYLVESDEEDGFHFKSRPCPFLKDNLCSVYSARPDDCRSYPHLGNEDFVFRLNQACSNCPVCPIVYNVYELLKQELWRDEDLDDSFDDDLIEIDY
jgi:Fe-S-cluster containining protein